MSMAQVEMHKKKNITTLAVGINPLSIYDIEHLHISLFIAKFQGCTEWRECTSQHFILVESFLSY